VHDRVAGADADAPAAVLGAGAEDVLGAPDSAAAATYARGATAAVAAGLGMPLDAAALPGALAAGARALPRGPAPGLAACTGAAAQAPGCGPLPRPASAARVSSS